MRGQGSKRRAPEWSRPNPVILASSGAAAFRLPDFRQSAVVAVFGSGSGRQ